MPEAQLYGTAGKVMTREVITVTPETSIGATAKVMSTHQISGVPVVGSESRLLGLVSEADLLRGRKLATDREASWLNMLSDGESLSPEFVNYVRTGNDMVRMVMHTDVSSVAEDTPLDEVARLMVEKGLKRLPVITNGKHVGIVGRADLVKALGARRN